MNTKIIANTHRGCALDLIHSLVIAAHAVVEDAILTRLIEAGELLTIATGLFTELAENKNNWLFNFQEDITDARWALHNVIHDRSFA